MQRTYAFRTHTVLFYKLLKINFYRSAFRHQSSLPNKLLVNAENAPDDFEVSSAVVYDNFVSESEGESIVEDIQARMKRRRYEKGHWDAVILDFKEVELGIESELQHLTISALKKTREHLLSNHFEKEVTWLPTHAIDLKKGGLLKPHVDSVRFSGDIVAGISLLSPAIMRLRPSADVGRDPEEGFVDLLLKPLSLYALTGVCRYQYSHELLPSKSIFEFNDGTSTSIERDRRISLILRDAKED